MGDIITIIILVAIIGGLIAALIYMVRTLFMGLGMHLRATKTFVTRAGASDAYDMLKKSAVNGKVSEQALEQAIIAMLSKGATVDETLNFVLDSKMVIGMDAQKTRDFICRTEQKLRNIDNLEAHLPSEFDNARTRQVLDNKREELNRDVESAKDRLKI